MGAFALAAEEDEEQRYGSGKRVWSGKPNPQLVATVVDLPAGTALDVGSGEGADAIWLASRGWEVTGVDVSQAALDRAAGHASDAGVQVTWRQADVTTWDPAPAQFDLVSAQYLHLSRPVREALHRRLAVAVRPGGTLLIVGRHPDDLAGRYSLPCRTTTCSASNTPSVPSRPSTTASSPSRKVSGGIPRCRTGSSWPAWLSRNSTSPPSWRTDPGTTSRPSRTRSPAAAGRASSSPGVR